MTDTSAKGFFQTLFDFDFTSFLTMKFLKVIYAVFTGLLLLGGAIWMVILLSTGEPFGILMGLILAPVMTLVYLVLTRISFEIVALFFRIGENTQEMAARLGALPAGTGPAVGGPGAAPGSSTAPMYRPPSGGSGPAGRPVPPPNDPGQGQVGGPGTGGPHA